MKFSIIVVTYNRKKEFFECLESITAQICSYDYEVITIFNDEHSYLDRARKNFPHFKHLLVKKMTPAAARNLGIKEARGEWILFLDDDCILPSGYLNLVNFELGWDVLGGPDQTPPDSSQLQKAIGETLKSPLCMGPTYKRHFKAKTYLYDAGEDALILCNLWIKRAIFIYDGFSFNEDLFRNEENFLLKKLKIAGKSFHYNPELFVFHQRRNSLEKLAASIIKSGECRVKSTILNPLKREIIYFAPLIFLCLFIYTIFHPFSWLNFVFAGYMFTVVLSSFFRYKRIYFRYIYLHFFILWCYALGLTTGLVGTLIDYLEKFKESKSMIKQIDK
jgi:glycosyltransferase involved in cell wall biosynthesis